MTELQPDEKSIEFVLAAWPRAARSHDDLSWEPLYGDGSDRCFYRVSSGSRTALLVQGRDRAENRSYELIGRHLWSLNQAGPEFLAVDQEHGLFLIEDLGNSSLQNVACTLDFSGRVEMYQRVISLMANVHQKGKKGFDPKWCYQTPRYDRALILDRETGYFTAQFLRGDLGLTLPVRRLTPEFEALADAALHETEAVLMHRDFQSRNVMIKQGRPRLIDFQGARLGPPGYDLASLLYDPYTDLSEPFREEMRSYYIQLRTGKPGFDPAAFTASYHFLAVCRLLQVLGAYGFLSRIKGKPLFRQYIPPAVRSLKGLLDREEFRFMPELRRVIINIRRKIEGRT